MVCQAMIEDYRSGGTLGHQDEAGKSRYGVSDLEEGIAYAQHSLEHGVRRQKHPPTWEFAEFIVWAQRKISELRAEEVARHSRYPEHEKLTFVKDKSQAIGDFLSWLRDEEEVVLARRHRHSGGCLDDSDRLDCRLRQGELVPANDDVEKLLARYFKVDLRKLEDEKRALLEEARKIKPHQHDTRG